MPYRYASMRLAVHDGEHGMLAHVVLTSDSSSRLQLVQAAGHQQRCQQGCLQAPQRLLVSERQAKGGSPARVSSQRLGYAIATG